MVADDQFTKLSLIKEGVYLIQEKYIFTNNVQSLAPAGKWSTLKKKTKGFGEMRKTLVLITAVVLVLVSALVVFAAPEKLVVWADQGEVPTFEKIATEFTKQTGIAVEFVEIGMLDQRQKLALDGPAGKGPDVFTTPHDLVGQMAIMGLMEPLVVADDVLDQFTPASIQALSFDGDLYGLPWATESTALYYNKDIFPEIPETFEELVAMAKAVTSGDQYGLLFDIGDFYFSHAFFVGKGGYVFAPLEGGGLNPSDVGLAKHGGIAALDFLKSLVTDGIIPIGTNTGIAQSLFLEGKVGAIISGPWYLAEPRALEAEGKLNFGVAPLPPFASGVRPSPFSGVKGFYISSYSQYPAEAQQLIEFLTGRDGGFLIYKEKAQIPTRYDIMEMKEFQEDDDVYNFALQGGYATPMPNIPEMQAVWGNIADAINLVINENVDPAIALELAVEMIEEAIMEMQR